MKDERAYPEPQPDPPSAPEDIKAALYEAEHERSKLLERQERRK